MVNFSEEIRSLLSRGWKTQLEQALRSSSLFKGQILRNKIYDCPDIESGIFFPKHPWHVAYWVNKKGRIQIRVCSGVSRSSITYRDNPWESRSTRFAWYAKHIIKRLQKRCDKANNVDTKQLRKHAKVERKLSRKIARL